MGSLWICAPSASLLLFACGGGPGGDDRERGFATGAEFEELAESPLIWADAGDEGVSSVRPTRSDAAPLDTELVRVSRTERRLSEPSAPQADSSSIGGDCESIDALLEQPAVDGVLEAGLTLQAVVPQGWTAQQAIPEGNALSFALAWHPSGIYFFAEVTDPERSPAPAYAQVWAGDGLELFVDHDAELHDDGSYDAVGTRALIVGAPLHDDSNGERAAIFRGSQSLSEALEVEWVSSPTDSGYVIEALVEAQVLGLTTWELEAGHRVAFNVAHNVSFPDGISGPDGNRMGQYVLRLPVQQHEDEPYASFPQLSTQSFCRPVLNSL